MIVLRVEKADGGGPYRHDGYMRIHGVVDQDYARHPMPSTLSMRYWSFGFASEEQLLEWFSELDRHNLGQLGYDIVEFEIPAALVQEDDGQVLFDRDAARVISRAGAAAWLRRE